jgi:hypothetical protein
VNVSLCVVTGSVGDGLAGEVRTLLVTLLDSFGNRAVDGGEVFWSLQSEDPAVGRAYGNAVDIGNATHNVSFVGTAAGNYQLTIRMVSPASPLGETLGSWSFRLDEDCTDSPNCVTYDWFAVAFPACPHACSLSASTTSRDVLCMGNDGSEAQNYALCKDDRPTATMACPATASCIVYDWFAPDFPSCPTACRLPASSQSRAATCLGSDGSTAPRRSLCNGTEPVATNACAATPNCTDSVTFDWFAPRFPACPTACDMPASVHHREVDCIGNDGSMATSFANCTGVMPTAVQHCNATASCVAYGWYAPDFPICPTACGLAPSVQTRTPMCLGSDGSVADLSLCTAAQPADAAVCSSTPDCRQFDDGSWSYSSDSWTGDSDSGSSTGEVLGCDNTTHPLSFLGDKLCHPFFECYQLGYDEGDCGVCGQPIELNVSSKLDASLYRLNVYMSDPAVMVGSVSNQCSEHIEGIVRNGQLISGVAELLGQDCTVTLMTSTHLQVHLAYGGYLLPADELIFRDCLLHTEAMGHRALALQTHVSEPEVNAPMVAEISGPGEVGPCSTLRLYGAVQNGRGPRPLSVSWTTNYNGTGAESLRSQLATASNESRLTVGVEFPVDAERGIYYTFNLTVNNRITGELSSVVHSVVRSQADIPSVVIAGPRTIEVRRWQDLFVLATAQKPACSSSGDLQYLWSVSAPSDVQLSSNTDSSSLYVPAFTFVPGATVTLQVVVSVAADAAAAASASVNVHCTADPLVPDIGGGSRSVRNDASFILDASNSLDPSDPAHVFSSMLYHWQCEPITSSDRQANDGSWSGPDMACSAALGSDITASALPVNASALQPGADYRITVNIAKTDQREASTSVVISVARDLNPPTVSVDFAVQTKYNAGDKLSLRGVLDGAKATDSDVQFAWTCTSVSAAIDLAAPGSLMTSAANSNLVVAPYVLEPGRHYTFRVSVTTSDGTGFGEVAIQMNTSPQDGSVRVDPETGTALRTSFIVSSFGWYDEDVPLQHRYGFEMGGTDSALSGFGGSQTLDAVLPSSAEPFPVYVEVADAYLATARAQTLVRVEAYVPTESLAEDSSAMLAEISSKGDVTAMHALVDVLAALLNGLASRRRQLDESAAVSDADAAATRVVLITALSSIVAQSPMTPHTISRFAGTIEAATAGELPEPSAVDDALAVLEALSLSVGQDDDAVAPTRSMVVTSSNVIRSVVAGHVGDGWASAGGEAEARIRAALGVLERLLTVLQYARVAGEFPFSVDTPEMELRLYTDYMSLFSGKQLEFVQLPSGGFDSAAGGEVVVHAQGMRWHVDPLFFASSQIEHRGVQLTLASQPASFAVATVQDVEGRRLQQYPDAESLLTPFTVSLSRTPLYTPQGLNVSHWHCAHWSDDAQAWELSGSAEAVSADYVSCAFNSFGKYSAFYGVLPPPPAPPPVEDDNAGTDAPVQTQPDKAHQDSIGSLILGGSLLGIGSLGWLSSLAGHFLAWRGLIANLRKTKAFKGYLVSGSAMFDLQRRWLDEFERPSYVAVAVHRLRAHGTVCGLVCCYRGVLTLRWSQRVLVLITSAGSVLTAHATLASSDRSAPSMLVLCAAAALVPVAMLEAALHWFHAPTTQWLRAEHLALREHEAERAAERSKSASFSHRSTASPKSFTGKKGKQGPGLSVDVSSEMLSGGESPTSPTSVTSLGSPSYVSPTASVGLSLTTNMGPKWRPVRGLMALLAFHIAVLPLVLGPAALASVMLLDRPNDELMLVGLGAAVSWIMYLAIFDPVVALIVSPMIASVCRGTDAADKYAADDRDGASDPGSDLSSPTEDNQSEDSDDRVFRESMGSVSFGNDDSNRTFYAGELEPNVDATAKRLPNGKLPKPKSYKVLKADAVMGGGAKSSKRKKAKAEAAAKAKAEKAGNKKIPPGHNYLSRKELMGKKASKENPDSMWADSQTQSQGGKKKGKKGKKAGERQEGKAEKTRKLRLDVATPEDDGEIGADGLRDAERRALAAANGFDPVATVFEAVTSGGQFKWTRDDTGSWQVKRLDDYDFDVAFAEKDRRRAAEKQQTLQRECDKYPGYAPGGSLPPLNLGAQRGGGSRQASREKAKAQFKAKQAAATSAQMEVGSSMLPGVVHGSMSKAVSFYEPNEHLEEVIEGDLHRIEEIKRKQEEEGDSSDYEYYSTSEDENEDEESRARRAREKEREQRRKARQARALRAGSIRDRVSFMKQDAAEKGRVSLREDGRLRAVSYKGHGADAAKQREQKNQAPTDHLSKQQVKLMKHKARKVAKEEQDAETFEKGAALLRAPSGRWQLGLRPDEAPPDYSLPPGMEADYNPDYSQPPPGPPSVHRQAY